MHFGIYVPTSGDYDIAALAALAREAEASGWDGMFVWDNILATFDGTGFLSDTTIALAAIATATRRIRFGPLVTPPARRRPWKLAKEAATLDVMSGGRLVLGVGLGSHWDTVLFGDQPVRGRRSERYDEALELITALWSGGDVTFRGGHFAVDGARMVPAPVQRPRIPIWTAGYWPGTAPFDRAARWDGVVPLRAGNRFEGLEPAEVADCLRYIRAQRSDNEPPFDCTVFRTRPTRDAGLVADYEHAGATWWLEATDPSRESLDAFRKRVHTGPLR